MLNYESLKLISLASEYSTTVKYRTILSIIIIVVGIALVLWVRKNCSTDLACLIVFVVGFLCFIINENVEAPYYRVVIEVEPTQELTVEKMKANDNFEEHDGKLFFNCELTRHKYEPDEFFKSRKIIEKKIENAFNETIDQLWINEKMELEQEVKR